MGDFFAKEISKKSHSSWNVVLYVFITPVKHRFLCAINLSHAPRATLSRFEKKLRSGPIARATFSVQIKIERKWKKERQSSFNSRDWIVQFKLQIFSKREANVSMFRESHWTSSMTLDVLPISAAKGASSGRPSESHGMGDLRTDVSEY